MYIVRHWWGVEEKSFPEARLAELAAEVAQADREHPTVALKHESEWSLSYGRDHTVVFENVEDGEPRHLTGVSPEAVVELWRHLAQGDLEWLEKQAWQPGYGS